MKNNLEMLNQILALITNSDNSFSNIQECTDIIQYIKEITSILAYNLLIKNIKFTIIDQIKAENNTN